MRRRATARQRKIAAVIAAGTLALFASLYLAQRRGFDVGTLFGQCGMMQRTGLPCPTCWMTRSVLAFARGDLIAAYSMQPAAAFLCTLLVIGAFFAFLTSVFGVYFSALDRLVAEIRIRHIALGLLVILAAGWAVTLARALAARI
ncbi:MAG: hypothetical protein A2Y77_13840 [Planctomycetes bacterium RBG_13_62_9]|nr:MAG: hypothetical protein A2Y77_13840 [Planctomycetes bacterium RBG_13_62_9]